MWTALFPDMQRRTCLKNRDVRGVACTITTRTSMFSQTAKLKLSFLSVPSWPPLWNLCHYSTSSHSIDFIWLNLWLDPIETHNGDLLCPEAKLRSSASGKLDLMITDGELIQILTDKHFPHLAFLSLAYIVDCAVALMAVSRHCFSWKTVGRHDVL